MKTRQFTEQRAKPRVHKVIFRNLRELKDLQTRVQKTSAHEKSSAAPAVEAAT